jgi:hypothetical protein
VARDSLGNLYVSGFQLRKILPDGRIFTAADEYASYLAPDPFGNLFFLNGSQLKKINSQGIVTLLAEANLDGLAVDQSGNAYFFYLSDIGGVRLYKLAPDGTQTVVAGGGFQYVEGSPATQIRLVYPEGLAVDSDGNLYIADGRIIKVNTNGIATTVLKDGKYSDNPIKLMIGPSGTLYVSDTINLWKVNEQGQYQTAGGGGCCGDLENEVCYFAGFFFENSKTITFVNGVGGLVRQVTLNPDGTIASVTDLAGRGGLEFGVGGPAVYAPMIPFENALDLSGNLFVWQYNTREHTIHLRKIGADGILYALPDPPGKKDTIPPSPFLVGDAQGHLFLNYIYPNPNIDGDQPTQILRYAPDGTSTFVVGGGGFTEDIPAPANVVRITPIDAAPDAQGRLFFLTSSPPNTSPILKRLKMLDTDGFVYTLAGQGSSLADNIPATQAQLVNPARLTVDTQSRVFLTDGDLVRRVDQDGTIRR